MALVRILVDGDSLLHRWMDLAPGRPRHEAASRDELINRLTQYHDAMGTAITVVFDGSPPPGGMDDPTSARDVEIVHPRVGQTAHQLIERLVRRFQTNGEVLVITDFRAELGTNAGGTARTASCEDFIRMIGETLQDLEQEITNYNKRERSQFLRHF
jgi:predicted RNA-binding protein with PIN domain